MPIEAIYQREDFLQKLDYIRKKVDRALAERIEKSIKEKIALDPIRATKRIQAESGKPLRILRVGDWRIYFIYCKECRNEGRISKWNCEGCSSRPDESITLMGLDKREDAYNW